MTVQADEGRRKIDDMCKCITSQIRYIDTLLERSEAPQWMITKKCTKLKDLLDSVESLSNELIKKCNKINENLQHAISSTTDQTVVT